VIFSTKTVLQTLHEKHRLVLQTYASLRDSANAVPKTSLPPEGGFVGRIVQTLLMASTQDRIWCRGLFFEKCPSQQKTLQAR